MQDKPDLFSTALMWLLAELFEELPEAGDLPKPKLAFFFDEAHLLFNGATDAFVAEVVRTVRLIRSKGVGVFFVTQTPKDVPGDVLGQLGKRVQHALRAFTPDDAKALKATVSTFPRSDFYDLEELLPALGIGEAAVTVLDERGVPTPVVHTRLAAPQASMGPAPDVAAAAQASPLWAKYGSAPGGRVGARGARGADGEGRARRRAADDAGPRPRPARPHATGPEARRPPAAVRVPAGPGRGLPGLPAGQAAAEAGHARGLRHAAEEACERGACTARGPFSAEHEELRASIRAFVARELRPHARDWEHARWFPDDVFARMGELGLLGLKYPEALGGQGGDHLHDAVLVEELARCGSGGLAAGIGAHVGIATPPVFRFGTEEQHERYLVPAIRGEKIAALGITEPGAGSDVAAIRTRASRVDGGWVVDGEKTYITNGVRAHFVVTAVKTTERGRPPRDLLPHRRPRRGRDVVEARQARLARVGHGDDRLRRRLRPGGQPPRPRARGLRARHGELRLGAPAHGARRRGGDAGRLRPHGGLRPGAAGLRPPAQRPPGRPPPPRGPGHDDPRRAAARPTTRSSGSPPARTSCAR